MEISTSCATLGWQWQQNMRWEQSPETLGCAASAVEAPVTATASAEPRAAPAAAQLSPTEARLLQWLRQRDFAVRAHERAHVAAGGPYVIRAANYDYTLGPDGQRYATGGEVHIDTSPIPGDPAATIAKAQVIFRAAVAPVDPSMQDLRVAAQARMMEATARIELLRQRQQENPAAAPAGTGQQTLAAAGARLRRCLAEWFALPAAFCVSCFA